MKKLKQICEGTVVMLLVCFSTGARAQNQPQGANAGRISETVRTVSYPEAIYSGGIVPDWDRGYVIHHEIGANSNPDTPMVVMYDATGKRVHEGRIWLPGAKSVSIRRTAATRDGAILASGGTTMQDGTIQHFIAKTDTAGNTVQALQTGTYLAGQICEAPDGTVWSLGRAMSDGKLQHDADVLRHYSFEKGLLHSYLPQRAVEAPLRSKTAWFNDFGSYVRCGKDKVSVYLKFTNEYVEVDTSSFELTRWKLDEAVAQQREANGLAITDDGRVYASFRGSRSEGVPLVWGLYQIKAVSGGPVAALLPVAGTITTIERGKDVPPGTFTMLWGADGNQLVVWRKEGSDSLLSWINVIRSESTD
jgi:hypothetical protein